MKKKRVKPTRQVPLRLLIFGTALAAAAIAAYAALCAFAGLDPKLTGIIVLTLYLVVTFSVYFFYFFSGVGLIRDEKLNPALGNIMLDVNLRLHIPLLICDEGGKLIWHNRALTQLSGKGEALYGANIQQLYEIKPEQLNPGENGSGDGILIKADSRSFIVTSYRIKAVEKNYYLLAFNENTENVRLEEKIRHEHAVVAYIVLDNLDDLVQYVGESSRSAANEIEELLRGWAEEMGGVLREYSRDKYLMIFNAGSLEECIGRRFEILDAVRNIRVGESVMPVTVSMGIANTCGTLRERERAASAALDMALSRGGDQVALKTRDGMEFFGGKINTGQKKTKVRARVIANKLCSLISRSGNVLIMGHRYPDFDSIGACVGLARLAMFCGVGAKIIIDPSDANAARCTDKIKRLDEYSEVFVDSAAGLELIRSDTLLIIADVNNIQFVESPEIFGNVFSTVIIDHHRKSAEFDREPELSYIEPSASSACELIAEILELCLPQSGLLKEEADLLLAGILLDTKQFTRKTGTRTFSAALYLRGEDASPADAQALFKSDLEDFLGEAKFMSNMVIYRDRIAIAMSEGSGERVPAGDRVAAAKAAEKLLSVRGISAAFALVRIGEDAHISARSNDSVNVQLILEKLNGGGHFDVAGAQVANRSVADTLVLLKAAIDEYLDNM